MPKINDVICDLEKLVLERYLQCPSNNQDHDICWRDIRIKTSDVELDRSHVEKVISIRRKFCQDHKIKQFYFINCGNHYDVYRSEDYPNLVFKIRVPDFAAINPKFKNIYSDISNKEKDFMNNLSFDETTIDGVRLRVVQHVAPFIFIGTTCIMQKARPSIQPLQQLRKKLEETHNIVWKDNHHKNIGEINNEVILIDTTGLRNA